MAKSSQNKGSSYDTKQSLPKTPYTFPTIGDGITVMASSQEEANEKAAAIKENLAQYGSPEAPKAAAEKSADAKDAE